MAKKQVAKGQETQAELPPPPKLTAPKLLPWWKAWGLTLLLPMCLASFVASIVGLYVLTDQQNDKWISRSLFGQSYKILVSTNAAWSPFFFNGGLVGFVYCCIQLHRHRKALQTHRFLQRVRIERAPQSTGSGAKKLRSQGWCSLFRG